MNAPLTFYWFLRKKEEWNLCYPMGCQMNKLLEVYYSQIFHVLSGYPIGLQFHPRSAHWEALGLTLRLGCVAEKRGYSFGRGWVRGLVKSVSGDNGRMEWQLVGRYHGMLLQFRVLDPSPIPSLCDILSQLLTSWDSFPYAKNTYSR